MASQMSLKTGSSHAAARSSAARRAFRPARKMVVVATSKWVVG
jgi:hypothetical protein